MPIVGTTPTRGSPRGIAERGGSPVELEGETALSVLDRTLAQRAATADGAISVTISARLATLIHAPRTRQVDIIGASIAGAG